MQRREVFATFDSERRYQTAKWKDKPQSVGAFITLLDAYVQKAKLAWVSAEHDKDALDVIRKIGGIATAVGEQHGLPYREGYTPKDTFDARVYNEAVDLESKVVKLRDYITEQVRVKTSFSTLPLSEQQRLKQQLHAMELYLSILLNRITEDFK